MKEALERSARKKRILVIDDEASIRSSLGKMLTMAGYEVILAGNGAEAAQLWRERTVDLVILDLFMPEKDGLEAIIELRKQRPGLPIIAMSGGGTEAKLNLLPEAKLLGATMTIEKPFDPARMMKMVNSALKDTREEA